VKLLIDIYYHKITPEQALSGIENPEPGLISLYKKTYDHIFPLEELTYNTARLTNAEQNNFIDFYDGEIAYTDYCLGKFFESIDKLKLRDKTLVILTADHGESLGEHEIFANHVGIYNQQLYIPLIMRYPPKIKPGTVVESLVQSIDIVPTILNILNIPIDAAIRGKSLVELFDNQNKVLHECIYAEHANLVAVARIDRDWKYILPRRENESLDPTIYRHKTAELYNRQNDNAEKLNLGDSQPDMQISLDADVKKWENEVGMNKEALAHGTHEKLEPQVREGLKALGYIN
jgi:arylsulfatase A-like enzyme